MFWRLKVKNCGAWPGSKRFLKINLVSWVNLPYLCFMSKTKEITPLEYAIMWGKTRQYVTRLLSQGRVLNYVANVKKFGKIYILTIPAKLTKENFHSAKLKK